MPHDRKVKCSGLETLSSQIVVQQKKQNSLDLKRNGSDIERLIYSFLDMKALIALGQTSKRIKTLADSDEYWKNLYMVFLISINLPFDKEKCKNQTGFKQLYKTSYLCNMKIILLGRKLEEENQRVDFEMNSGLQTRSANGSYSTGRSWAVAPGLPLFMPPQTDYSGLMSCCFFIKLSCCDKRKKIEAEISQLKVSVIPEEFRQKSMSRE